MIDIRSFGKNRAVRNAGWLIGGQVIRLVVGFFVGIFMARYLGPSNYGLINYGAAYTGFFAAFCALGINSILVKELVDHKEQEGEILGTALLLKGFASLLSAVAVVCIVSVLDSGETTTIAVVALCSVGMVFNILETFNYRFQAELASRVTAVATLVGYLLTSAYKIYLMATGRSVLLFALATSLDYVCVGVILIVSYFRRGGQRLRVSLPCAKRLLSRGCHFILPSLMVAIYAQTDKFMLKRMISETEIAYYSTASSLSVTWCFVLGAIIDSVTPEILEAFRDGDTERYRQKNRMLYALVFYISVVVSVLFCLLAYPLVFHLYGDAYLPAVAPLRIVTWYTAFSYLGVARGAWVVCENKQKYLIWIYLSAALSNVVLNLLLIPPLGACGAALASCAAQVVTIAVPFLMPPLRPNAILMAEAIALKGVSLSKKQRK